MRVGLHGPIMAQGWMRALVGKVWQKQAASEARAYGSTKISGKALGVQHKNGFQSIQKQVCRAKVWA